MTALLLAGLLAIAPTGAVEARGGSQHPGWGPWRTAQYVTAYGPESGHQMACGGHRLTRHTWAVAHRRLPCGTRLQLRYGGRTVEARVWDRGPWPRFVDAPYTNPDLPLDLTRPVCAALVGRPRCPGLLRRVHWRIAGRAR